MWTINLAREYTEKKLSLHISGIISNLINVAYFNVLCSKSTKKKNFFLDFHLIFSDTNFF